MNRIILFLICSVIIVSSQAQTIVWKEIAPLPEGYNGGEAVTLNNEIYFVAGRTQKAMSAAFYKFSPKTNKWTRLADIPKPATNFAMAVVNGKIYAIGGDQFQDANREYDPETNSWKLLTPMPTARQHINCGVHGNEIFIAGGLTSWKNITQKHEVYNVLTDSWSEKAAIPSLRNNATVVSLNSLMYVLGGAGTKDNIWGDVLTVETYNFKSDTWVQKNDLPQLLFGPGVTVVNNEIIVLGGQTREGTVEDATTKVFIYKAKTDQWFESTPLPIKNVFFGCTSIDNKIYVIGGTVGGNPNWENYSAVYEGTIVEASDKQIFNHSQIITPGRIWDVAFEDINKDNYSDLVVANWFSPPTIYYNSNIGDFNSFKPLPCYEAKDSSNRVHGIGIADFNGDKSPDILAVFNGLNNLVYFSENNEFVLKDTLNTNNSDGLNISLGDIDNDDDIDAVVTNYKQLAMLWLNNGNGRFARSEFDFGLSKIINSTALGDMNDDGNLDIICSLYQSVVVWFNKGNGVFEKMVLPKIYDKGYGTVKLADLDNDHDLDIIFSNNSSGTSIWTNNGKGEFSVAELKLSNCIHLAIGDLDLNGFTDIVCGKTVWLNNGNQEFVQHETFDIEERIFGLWLNDIDNDGDLDLFYSSSNPEKGLVMMKNYTNKI